MSGHRCEMCGSPVVRGGDRRGQWPAFCGDDCRRAARTVAGRRERVARAIDDRAEERETGAKWVAARDPKMAAQFRAEAKALRAEATAVRAG